MLMAEELMTEEKAKEILDFLARKAGCVEVDIRISEVDGIGIIGCISSNLIKFRALIAGNILRITSKDCSYAECLRKIFKMSKAGYAIKIYAWQNLFLEANTDLENILVEMDLAT